MDYDVVIAGAGPVGLLKYLLASYALPVSRYWCLKSLKIRIFRSKTVRLEPEPSTSHQ